MMAAEAQDFAVRLKGLIELGRSNQEEQFKPVLEELMREKETCWRLALLEALFLLPYEDKVTPLIPLLAEDLDGDELGFFLCGLVWFLGNQGVAAIEPLTRHLLAKPGRARRIKDGLLTEAIFWAAGRDRELINKLAAASPHLYRFCSNRLWPRYTNSHYGIYPHPDYLWQIAKQKGLSQQEFKALYYRPRKKREKGAN